MLVREDGPILEMRKWYGRFYPSGRLHEKTGPTDVVTR